MRPNHYEGPIEAIEIIEAIVSGLDGKSGFLLGNILKYALRAGRKGNAEDDLRKASDYAHRLVSGAWAKEDE